MIKRLRIQDFKSIGDIELELGEVTVLVGRSGSGKSNLVHSLRFLRNLLLNYDDAISYEHGWGRIMPVGKAKPRTSIDVTFTVPGEQFDYNYRVAFNSTVGQSNTMSLTEERLTIGTEEIFSRERPATNANFQWIKAPQVSPLPHVHESKLFLGLLPSLHQVVYANAALSTGIGYYHFPSSALTFTGHQHGHDWLQRIPGLSDTANNYLSIVRAITQDFHNPNARKGILASIKEVNASIASIELDSLVNTSKVIVGHRAGNTIFDLSLEQESDGLRRFYAHLLALYQTPAKLLLIFEEPENAIFPGALSLLADEFNSAPKENRGQVILTTHSPTLLDSFDVENVRVVEIKDSKTIVGRVSKEQRDAVKDHLLTTGDLLRVDPARLDVDSKAQQPT